MHHFHKLGHVPHHRLVSAWTVLDLSRPMAHAREVAGLSASEARAALDLPPTPGGSSTMRSAEQNEAKGMLPRLERLLERCRAYGLEIEIRIRPARPRYPAD